jgi:predicted HTH transcriptional regulator
MAKKSRAQDPEGRAERRLVKAQLALELAQDKLAQARERGRQEVDRARLLEAKWLAKASARVERRLAAVAAAEDELRSLQPAATDTGTGDGVAAESNGNDAVAVVALAVAAGDTQTALGARARKALHALQQVTGDEGMTAAEWARTAGISDTTLARARNELIAAGYVSNLGQDGRGARYVVTDSGRGVDAAGE